MPIFYNETIKDCRLLRMPPMMEHQQLGYATERMNRPKAVPYRRYKLTSPETNKSVPKEETVVDPEDIQSPESPGAAIATESSEAMTSPEAENKGAEEPTSDTKIKRVSIGSPVPESYKKKKPPLEKWSENNSLPDLIYFENLPNSTGVFDKMRGIIKKVRDNLFAPSDKKESA